MITTIGVIIALILFIISALHIYWSAGGEWGFGQALPKDKAGNRVINPRKIDCAIVAAGLFSFALFYLIRVEVISIQLPEQVIKYGIWVISVIFALRAVGDFKYIGFTKTIQETDFARLDTRYYSPVCVLLALGGIIIELSN